MECICAAPLSLGIVNVALLSTLNTLWESVVAVGFSVPSLKNCIFSVRSITAAVQYSIFSLGAHKLQHIKSHLLLLCAHIQIELS